MDGDDEGEETDVRGAGTGHLRTGSSTILLLSISSIMYSESRGDRGEKTRTCLHWFCDKKQLFIKVKEHSDTVNCYSEL